MELLVKLGFKLNLEKSVLEPTQSITFLRLQIDSLSMKLLVPKEKKKSVIKEIRNLFNGVNELLYGKEFKIPKEDGIFDKHLVYLKVINKPEYENLFKDFHAGHLGRDKTYQKFLDAGFYYSGLYTQVEIDCNTCDNCQRINIKGSKKEHKPIQDKSPYDRICYDLTSMNLEHRESVYHEFENWDENFNKNWDQLINYNTIEPKHSQTVYILLAIDSFTKIAKGRCLTTKRAVPIYNFLATAYKGLPIKKWHCDNGREFKNKVLDEFIKLFPESKSVHGAPRTPTSQGVIERLNQTIKNTIRGLMQQDFTGPSTDESVEGPVKSEAQSDATASADKSADNLKKTEKSGVKNTQNTTNASANNAGNTASTQYILQVGAYKNKEDAEREKGNLAMQGLEANITTRDTGDGVLYRVRLGPYTQLEQMNQARSKNYQLIKPAQTPESKDKIEVIEFFWYACPHCAVLLTSSFITTPTD
ncbi:hypothetical protein ACTFIZ_012349 [Dictyostelium cf. discoideum]